jgi:predicted phage-related endonuclease
VSWCHELGAVQQQIKALEADENRLKGLIANQLGEAAEGHHEGRRLVTWRGTTRTTVDVRRLRAERPDVAKEYHQTSTHRALRLLL